MAKISIKIELSEKDLLSLIAEKYNLNLKNSKISISRFEGNQREPSYTTVIVEGTKE